jgi:DNA-binding MarR family transcriptional regulator
MSKRREVSFETTLFIRDTCLCLHVQQAARALARRFDEALRPLDLTNGQFSLLMSLNRPEPPNIGAMASLLGMDRTTLTAALKPLQRRALVETKVDAQDKRERRVALTPAGQFLLARAIPVWKQNHARIEKQLGRAGAHRLRRDLGSLALTRS